MNHHDVISILISDEFLNKYFTIFFFFIYNVLFYFIKMHHLHLARLI